MVQRPSNIAAKPASGPDSSEPAIGWPGIANTPRGMTLAKASAMAALTEPTSVTVAPGFKGGADGEAFGGRADSPGRSGENHQVGAVYGLRRVGRDGVGQAQSADACANRFAGIGDGDLFDQAPGPRGANHRRSNQAAADHGQPGIEDAAHPPSGRCGRPTQVSTMARPEWLGGGGAVMDGGYGDHRKRLSINLGSRADGGRSQRRLAGLEIEGHLGDRTLA